MPYRSREKRLKYFREYNKKHYQKDKEKYLEKSRRWKKENPERSREHRRKNHKKCYNKRKEDGVCVRCGLPFDEDDILLNGVGLKCSVCRTKERAYNMRVKGYDIPLPISFGGNNR